MKRFILTSVSLTALMAISLPARAADPLGSAGSSFVPGKPYSPSSEVSAAGKFVQNNGETIMSLIKLGEKTVISALILGVTENKEAATLVSSAVVGASDTIGKLGDPKNTKSWSAAFSAISSG